MTLYEVKNTMKHRRASSCKFTWNDEAAEFAKQCHADGLTATQAMVKLNHKFGGRPTRSAVCGFWWRHGLHRAAASTADKALGADRRAARLAARAAKQSQQRAQQRAARISAMATDNAQALAETTPNMASFVPAKEHRKQLLELTNTTCRWPYGDPGTPDFFFCGNEADLESNRPYCPRHMEMACAHVPEYSKGYSNFLCLLGR